MNRFSSKVLLVMPLVAASLASATSSSAQDCATCCHVRLADYACLSAPVGDPQRCNMGDPLEQDTCSIYPGITFSEQPGKRLQVDWNGQQPNGPLPTNAVVFGFSNPGVVVCSMEVGGFVRSVEKSAITPSGDCNAATHWSYDANAS